jgi:hypothetical protein
MLIRALIKQTGANLCKSFFSIGLDKHPEDCATANYNHAPVFGVRVKTVLYLAFTFCLEAKIYG